MPWWFWILLWLALVALALLFFVVLGIRLFRQFMATVKELGEAGDRFGLSVPAAAPDDKTERATGSPGAALFASPQQLRHEYEASKAVRRELRRQRRVKRKAERGQPQALYDIDFR